MGNGEWEIYLMDAKIAITTNLTRIFRITKIFRIFYRTLNPRGKLMLVG